MKRLIFTLGVISIITACRQDKAQLTPGNLTIHFNTQVNGTPVAFNSMQYINAAGNHYEVTNVQWFITDVSFIDNNGDTIPASQSDWIHYVDTDLPETQTWTIKGIEPGEFRSIIFTFGIKGIKNVPNMFTDPPESNMLWPYEMGGDEGGYHYMKFNGFWLNPANERTPFNCHLGVGQIYDSEGNITGFVQNWFEVSLPSSSFTLPVGGAVEANLNMNLENWFEGPNVFDWNVYGGAIMANQEAMGKIRDNGHNVFSIQFITNESGS